jgi:hypothetical protein
MMYRISLWLIALELLSVIALVLLAGQRQGTPRVAETSVQVRMSMTARLAPVTNHRCAKFNFYLEPIDFATIDRSEPGRRTASLENRLFCMSATDIEEWLSSSGLNRNSLPPFIAGRLGTDAVGINAYPDKTVARQGETIEFALAAGVLSDGHDLTGVDVFHLADDEEILHIDLSTVPQRVPRAACVKFFGSGCDYPFRWSLDTADIEPGAYYLRFLTKRGSKPSAPVHFFINATQVVNEKRLLFLLPTLTMQAYNSVGGASFYPQMVSSENYRKLKVGNLHEVSLQRPLGAARKPPRAYRNFSSLSRAYRDLREEGWAIRFVDDMSLHRDPAMLDRHRLALVMGHAEYWTASMQQALESYLGRGGSLANFSGNILWWRPRLNEESAISLCRCPAEDPRPPRFADSRRIPNNRDLVGVSMMGFDVSPEHERFTSDSSSAVDRSTIAGYLGVTATVPDHPIFRAMDFSASRTLGAESGWMGGEIDGVELNADGDIDRQIPGMEEYRGTVLGTSYAATRAAGKPSTQFALKPIGAIVDYQGSTPGSRVLTLGSMGFVYALAQDDPIALTFFRNTLAYLWNQSTLPLDSDLNVTPLQ